MNLNGEKEREREREREKMIHRVNRIIIVVIGN